MKSIVLYSTSAIEAWDLGLCAKARPVAELDLAACARNAEELRVFNGVLPQLTRPIHILAPDKDARRQSQRWRCHTLHQQLPRYSFCEVTSGVYVAAPYLCFLHFARKLCFAHAILLGMELCGGYSTLRAHRDAHRTSPDKGYLERKPLSAPMQIQRYLEACGLGRNAVPRRVARLLQKGAASPREAITHALLRPGITQGGFGIEGYEINGEIPLPPDLAKAAGVNCFRGDFYWHGHNLVLEYDGKDYHADDAQRTYDNFRRTVLGQMGIRVISLDKKQLGSLETVEHVAGAVAEHTGRKLTQPGARSLRARAELHRQLLIPDVNLYR